MNLEKAQKVRNQIAAFLQVDDVQRRGPGAPRVAIGIAPSDTAMFKIAIRAPSQKDLDRALGDGASREVNDMADDEVDIRVTGEVAVDLPSAPGTAPALAIGASVGHYRSTAGTLGFFAQRLSDGAVGFVSNNHVIADCDQGKSGDDILSPAPMDHGDRSKDTVAHLVPGYPLLQKNGAVVDVAFALLRDGVPYDASDIGGAIRLQPVLVPLFKQRKALKFGRSSGLTYGRISAFALQNLDIEYPALGKSIRFDWQIEITSDGDQPFSKPGDSGSLVVNPEGHPIGLLFAATRNGGYAYANPIADVMRELDVRLIT